MKEIEPHKKHIIKYEYRSKDYSMNVSTEHISSKKAFDLCERCINKIILMLEREAVNVEYPLPDYLSDVKSLNKKSEIEKWQKE